jgi:hypothetical protein
MLLAPALYAAIAHAGIPAGFGGTAGVANKNTPHCDLEQLYHDGRARSVWPEICEAQEPISRERRGRPAQTRND